MQELTQPINAPQQKKSSGTSALGYTLWQFDGATWQMKKNCAVNEFVISRPPTLPGLFKGQLRATACSAA